VTLRAVYIEGKVQLMAGQSSNPFLSSLYIYNPSLSQADDSIDKQLVFHYSPSIPSTPASSAAKESDKRLRAIGLAQGIVEFARAFSPESLVQVVRTQNGFSVPVEVEKSWWMLAVHTML
jgi:hypothetical protein